MAIKALKQSISISEMQKTIHRWKRRGLNDSTITKLLDLYLGIPAYMDAQCVYPLCNFYDIRLSLRFAYTATLLADITNCQSFGLIWDDTHTKIIAFYSPLWYRKEETPQDSPQDSAQKTPQDSAQKTPQDSAFNNNNILYNINNIYPPKGDFNKTLLFTFTFRLFRPQERGKELHRPMPPMRHHAPVYLEGKRPLSLFLRRMRVQRHPDRLLLLQEPAL